MSIKNLRNDKIKETAFETKPRKNLTLNQKQMRLNEGTSDELRHGSSNTILVFAEL